MGAITETLFESELFGHVKGAYTDARENRPGKFEIADKGSLFLDEIGNLPFHLQAKLLAAIQNRQISRVGSNHIVPVDIRLICATNKNLEIMVQEGLFREDLLYRINTIQIEVPPLRERENDVMVLADFFLRKFSVKYNKPGLKINQQAQEKLIRYNWPGNIRELQHTLEKAVILCEGKILRSEDFLLKPVMASQSHPAETTLEEMEKRMVDHAIRKNHGNLSAAAEQLGITRQTLYNKIKRFGQ
jgi:transcriptional regulator with PAS, ATPase and Fis domain